MRTEYLKELELLPVWQLRKPLPGVQESLEQHAQTESAVQETVVTEAAIASAAPESPNVVVYMSEGADLQLIHFADDLTQEAQQLSRNIARSMRLKPQSSVTLDLALQQANAVVLILGESLAQSVLARSQTLQELRGEAHTIDHKQIVVTDDLQAMLRQPEIKAQVWKDCCLAMSLLSEKAD